MSVIEITNRDDLRAGDTATFAYDGHEFTGPLWSEVGNDLAIGDMLVRLPAGTWLTAYSFVRATRVVPDLPTEPGSVILVTAIDESPIEPTVAMLDDEGDWMLAYRRIERWSVASHQITEWTPAKVVPA